MKNIHIVESQGEIIAVIASYNAEQLTNRLYTALIEHYCAENEVTVKLSQSDYEEKIRRCFDLVATVDGEEYTVNLEPTALYDCEEPQPVQSTFTGSKKGLEIISDILNNRKLK